VLLYAILRLQAHLPYAQGHSGLSPALAWDTAVFFVTNTSWQNYSGEATTGYAAVIIGLGIEAFASADGAANSSYDSFSAFGGGLLLSAMMLGEISPGGVGSGLYGLLVVALIAVFLGGLMVGRTPEFLRKQITARQMTHVALYYLATPFVLLAGSLAKQKPGAVTAGTLRTTGPMFVSLATASAIVLVGLTFLPALALGPLADGLHG